MPTSPQTKNRSADGSDPRTGLKAAFDFERWSFAGGLVCNFSFLRSSDGDSAFEMLTCRSTEGGDVCVALCVLERAGIHANSGSANV